MRYPTAPMQQKFHRDVFFPKELREVCQAALTHLGGKYQMSHHARDMAGMDDIRLPQRLPDNLDIIEATFLRAQLEKMLVRFRQDDRYDTVLGLTVEGVVTTVFLNLRSDTHRTLRRHEYARKIAA